MADYIPGFDALGFQIEMGDDARLEALLKSLWRVSDSFPSNEGDCGRYQEDYLSVWSRFTDDGFDQVIGSNGMPGIVVDIEEYIGRECAKVWIWDKESSSAQEPLYPLCVRTPHGWFPNADASLKTTGSAAVSLIAREAVFFKDEAQLNAHPELGRFAAECVIPTGLFADDGEQQAAEPRPRALVVGRVLLAVRQENELSSNSYYHALRVRTLGGEMWVNLPDGAISGDVTGKIITVQGLISMVIPHQVPEKIEPIGKEEDLRSGPEIEAEMRRLAVAFFEDPERSGSFIGDIHGRKATKYWSRYQAAARNAPIVFGHIVMANTMVLHEGLSSPALFVVAFGEGADEVMAKARRVLARVHFDQPTEDREKALSALIEDENYRFGRRRRLPEWLVGGVEAYAVDLWIPGEAAYEDGLLSEVLPVFAERGADGLTSAIPTNVIHGALGRPPVALPGENGGRESAKPAFRGTISRFKKLALLGAAVFFSSVFLNVWIRSREPEAFKEAVSSLRRDGAPIAGSSGDGFKLSKQIMAGMKAPREPTPLRVYSHTGSKGYVVVVRMPERVTTDNLPVARVWDAAQSSVKTLFPEADVKTPLTIAFYILSNIEAIHSGTLIGPAEAQRRDIDGSSLHQFFE